MSRIDLLKEQLNSSSACSLHSLRWPEEQLRLLIAAPHPDDFDAIAVTLKFFQQRDDQIDVLVLSGGSKGVDNSYPGIHNWKQKAQLREREQRASCDIFGLSKNNLTFLRLAEAEDGELSDSQENAALLHRAIYTANPDLILLPYGDDYNTGHARTFEMVRQFAKNMLNPCLILYNKDIKTISFRTDIYTQYPQSVADWKSQLLRCHHTQQLRNLNHRGYGFDERIRRFNQQTANSLKLPINTYAEAFQAEFHSGSTIQDQVNHLSWRHK